MAKVEKHFVTFFSPGTFFDEETTKPIKSWDVEEASGMAHTVLERYDATPFAFQFSTRSRGDDDLDSKESGTSPMYYLGGRIETRDQIMARNDPKEDILRRNMRSNDIDRVIVNDNSWRTIRPLRATDIILDFKPKKKRRKVA